jgi:hypothetical protein
LLKPKKKEFMLGINYFCDVVLFFVDKMSSGFKVETISAGNGLYLL